MTKSEINLRAIWDANGVPLDRQEEILADVTAKAQPNVAWSMACAGYGDARLAGESDREYQTRIDAQRVTAELKTRSAKRLDRGRIPIDESPLFGGRKQHSLFGGDE